MRTRYDWRRGARGSLLEPAGSSSLQQLVFVRSDGGVLGELYERGALIGEALADARERFGEKKDRGGDDAG